MILAAIGAAPNAVFSVPARSIQSRLRIDVGRAENLRPRRREESRRGHGVQRVIGGKRRRLLDVGEHARAELLGERHALVPRPLAAAHAAGEDHRAPRTVEQPRGVRERLGRRLRRRRGSEPRGIGHRGRSVEPGLLQPGVEADVDRPARRRVREQRRAQDRLLRRGGGRGLVVPLGVVAHERALVARGVDPVDPRPALRRVHRSGRAENEHRHAVAPRVEDRHGRVHQADVRVHRRCHHAPRHPVIAVRDRRPRAPRAGRAASAGARCRDS